MGSCYRSQRRFCAKKRENISIVENREKGSIGICEGSVEKGVYLAIKITTNVTSILCAKKGWKEKNDARLLIFEQLGNQK